MFGRGDYFGWLAQFHMDIFRTGDRRLLMRCWSGSRYTKSSFSASFEIKGLTAAMLSKTDEYGLLLQSYIPVEVRRAYDGLIYDEHCEQVTRRC